MSYELRRLASRKLPNVDDVANMASSVEEFTNRLIDPLKCDFDLCARFERCFDDVMENAIEFEQKKGAFLKQGFSYIPLNTSPRGGVEFDELQS